MRKLLALGMILFLGTVNLVDANTFISKSAVVFVANEKTFEIPPWGSTYLPCGTQIYNKNINRFHNGRNRELFITETGLHIYIEKNKYWDETSINAFKKLGPTVFIKRNYPTKVVMSPDVSINVKFTRGETYTLVEEKENSYRINGNQKNKIINSQFEILVNIPKPYAKINYFEFELDENKIDYFERIQVNGVYGIRQGCGTGINETYPLKGSMTIGEYFKETGIKPEVELNELKGLCKDVSIRREYYKRKNKPGIYKITRLKACDDSRRISFHISTPYTTDVFINKDWMEKCNAAIRYDQDTDRALIKCPKDYFTYEAELKEEFVDQDIPFIIYKTGKWENFRNDCPPN